MYCTVMYCTVMYCTVMYCTVGTRAPLSWDDRGGLPALSSRCSAPSLDTLASTGLRRRGRRRRIQWWRRRSRVFHLLHLESSSGSRFEHTNVNGEVVLKFIEVYVCKSISIGIELCVYKYKYRFRTMCVQV